MLAHVYTNFPGWSALSEACANALGDGHPLHMTIDAVVHGQPALMNPTAIEALPDAPIWEPPVRGVEMPWKAFRESRGLPAGATPATSVGAALEAYWSLARCAVLVVWLDNEADIVALIAQASMSRIPIVGVTERFSLDPVIASMLTITVPPRKSVVYATVAALILQQRCSSEGSKQSPHGEE